MEFFLDSSAARGIGRVATKTGLRFWWARARRSRKSAKPAL